MGKFMRDYDKEPIIVKNDYLLKSELALRIFFILLAIIFAVRNAIPIDDLLHDHLKKAILALCLFLLFDGIFKNLAMVKQMIKNNLQIRVFEKTIECDYIDLSGNLKTLEFRLTETTNITYSYVPNFGENIKAKNLKIFEKLMNMVVYIPVMLINFMFIFIFWFLNFFKIEKYYILENEDMIISIKQNKPLIDKFSKVAFDKRSLTECLINHGSKIFNGG